MWITLGIPAGVRGMKKLEMLRDSVPGGDREEQAQAQV